MLFFNTKGNLVESSLAVKKRCVKTQAYQPVRKSVRIAERNSINDHAEISTVLGENSERNFNSCTFKRVVKKIQRRGKHQKGSKKKFNRKTRKAM